MSNTTFRKKQVCSTYSATAQFQMSRENVRFTTYLVCSISMVRNMSVVLVHTVFNQIVQESTLSGIIIIY